MKIFLTGGTDGIGLSASKILLTDGHQLYVTYRNSKKLEKILARFLEKLEFLKKKAFI